MKRTFIRIFVILTLALTWTNCSTNRILTKDVRAVADQVWSYSQKHPDGFTLELSTISEPQEGISVAYAATQGCHSRSKLNRVVRHALRHDGYVGGWLDTTDSLYYFDSTRIFPEDSLDAALQFGAKNRQIAVFILSSGTEVRLKNQ
ncbi:MAG: hypothetical protein K6A41_00565 [Bacteroidales bacterium]|nr:hypothetical protein [Bacteroidales bacterium]